MKQTLPFGDAVYGLGAGIFCRNGNPITHVAGARDRDLPRAGDQQ
jgi:hypothetical protein